MYSTGEIFSKIFYPLFTMTTGNSGSGFEFFPEFVIDHNDVSGSFWLLSSFKKVRVILDLLIIL